jgi:hypothetical protein
VKAGKSEQIGSACKKLAKAEDDPQNRPAKSVLQATQRRYHLRLLYTTDIGIHKDIEYKGNVIQEQFSGYERKLSHDGAGTF